MSLVGSQGEASHSVTVLHQHGHQGCIPKVGTLRAVPASPPPGTEQAESSACRTAYTKRNPARGNCEQGHGVPSGSTSRWQNTHFLGPCDLERTAETLSWPLTQETDTICIHFCFKRCPTFHLRGACHNSAYQSLLPAIPSLPVAQPLHPAPTTATITWVLSQPHITSVLCQDGA